MTASLRRASRHLWRPFSLAALYGILLLAVQARAQPLSLGEAVHAAIVEAPAGRITQLQSERAADAAALANSAVWPSAVLTSRAGYSNRLDDTLEAVDAEGDVHEYGLATLGAQDGWFSFYVRQMLFDLAAWNGMQRAELEAEVATIAADQQRQVLAFETLTAFASVLQLEDLVAQHQTHLQQLDRLAAQAAALANTGRGLRAETLEVDLYQRESELTLAALRDELLRARRGLARRIGKSEVETPLLRDSLPLPDVNESVVPETSPELRMLDLQRRIAELGVATARAGSYPTVAIGAGYTHYGAKRYDNFADEMRVGIDFAMPVFEGHRVGHSVAGATKEHEIARLSYESMLVAKQQRLDAAAARWRIAAQRLPLADERKHLAAERVRLADLDLDADRGSVGIAVATRRELELVTRDAVVAAYAPLLAWAELQREAGQLVRQLDSAAGAD